MAYAGPIPTVHLDLCETIGLDQILDVAPEADSHPSDSVHCRSQIHLPNPHRPSVGEPCTSPSDRRAQAFGEEATEVDVRGSCSVGPAIVSATPWSLSRPAFHGSAGARRGLRARRTLAAIGAGRLSGRIVVGSVKS